jgi:23S rRNA (guanosine2251-2'-O)-methyltransferase
MDHPAVRRLIGAREILAALDVGTRVRRILVRDGSSSEDTLTVLERARAAGILVSPESENEMRRMSPDGRPREVLGFTGRDPEASLEDALAGAGAVWLLSRVDYPSNVGVAVRTAEVAGADAVVVDGRFSEREKQQALRFSIRAERFMPVLWESSETVLNRCAGTARRLVAVESSGTMAPWEVDLRGPVLLILGNERSGIPGAVLARCTCVVRIPMLGFIPSYNLQASVAAIAGERLRQLGMGWLGTGTPGGD